MSFRSVVIGVAALAALTGCSKKEGTASNAAAITPEVEEVFTTRCATCHGTDGTGSGPAAANLNPKPRNYTDSAWQASVTDDYLRNVIVKGGAANGKSPLMPPNPDLESKSAVVDGLVAKVRSFKK
jgi:mono/diheme cytochrome c family protein